MAAVALANLVLVMGIGLGPICGACASAQHKITALFNSTPEGVLEVARDGTILFVNEQLCKHFDYDSRELLGKSVDVLVPVEARAWHAGKRGAFLASASSRPMGSGLEARGVRKDGTEIPLDISLTCIEAGRSAVTYCMVRDISAAKAYERRLLQANREPAASVAQLEHDTEKLRQLTQMGELLHSSLTETALFSIVAHVMHRLFPQLSGCVYVLRDTEVATAEAVTRWGNMSGSLRCVMPLDGCWALRCSCVHEVIDRGDEPRCHHYCDQTRWPARCVPLMGHGELLGAMHVYFPGDTAPHELTDGTCTQIIQAAANQIALSVANLRLRETLRHQSLLDPLTGLYNRRAVHQRFEHEVRSAACSERPLSALLIDIDHFKRFNDQYGHGCGDAALPHLADVLRNGLRDEDLVCRLGGEEFAVLLPDTSMTTAMTVAEKLRVATETLIFNHQGQAIGPLTISIGLAVLGSATERSEELLRYADLALYRAKASGRNCVQASNELDRSGVLRQPSAPESRRMRTIVGNQST